MGDGLADVGSWNGAGAQRPRAASTSAGATWSVPLRCRQGDRGAFPGSRSGMTLLRAERSGKNRKQIRAPTYV